MLLWLTNALLKAIEQIGYLGVFVLMSLESCGIPIPSEIVVPFSGYLAKTGAFSLLAVIAVTSIANLSGSLALYLIGKKLRETLFSKSFLWIRKNEVIKASKIFNRYGDIFVFTGRILPVVRTYISLPAGISGMNLARFCAYTLIGSIIWNSILAYAGFVLGETWIEIAKALEKVDVFVLIALVLGIAYYRKRK